MTRVTLFQALMSHPSQVIVDAVAAIQREDWKAFIELCDPVSIRRFKNDLVWQFSDHGYSPPFTVEDFLIDEPDISREVAEYYFSQMNGQRDPAFRLSLEMRTVSSLEELESLEPSEVLIRWLKSRMLGQDDGFSIRKWQSSAGFEVTEDEKISEEEIEDDFRYKPKYVVLGSVRDGGEFAHVICRHADYDDMEDEEDADTYTTPRDERELNHALRNRTLMLNALCRRQPDGTWRLIAERNLFFLPMMSIVT